jgi:phosphatidylinositol alpha-mannosyltransferase
VKIALVSPYDWSYPGGVCNHIEHLAAELRHRGHTVRILTPASGPQGHIKEYGIYKFSWVAPIHLNGSVARVAVTPAITGRLNRIMQRERFDIVHVHEPMASTLTLTALRVARDRGAACVATFHAASTKRASTARWAYAMASPFLQASFQRLDGCIAVSEAARDHVARSFPADYTIIPNGIDVARFADATPFPAFQDGKRNVLFFGRMEPRKGLRFLLKAIPLVREHYQGQPVRFIVVGDGPQREKFEKYIQRQGWPDVVFTGYVDDAAKLRYFASADVYVAPNTGNESQGIVLLEAMAAGAPVVASDIPGFRTVITTQEIGLLAPPRNAERLAWAICHILRDDTLRAALAARGRARAQDFSWEAVAADIEQVYRDSSAHSAERLVIHRLRFGRLRRSVQAARAAVVGVLDTSG